MNANTFFLRFYKENKHVRLNGFFYFLNSLLHLIPLSHVQLDQLGSFVTRMGFLKNYSLKPGDIVIDAGAYFGFFARYASGKVGPSGKIIAYEPVPEAFAVLERTVKEAGLTNVILINKGLYNRKGVYTLSSDDGPSTFRVTPLSQKKDGPRIETVTLDSEIKRLKLKRIDIIKMDIEEAEIEALETAKETMKITKHWAIACYHVRNGKTTGVLLQPVLKKFGYKTSIGFSLHPTLYADR